MCVREREREKEKEIGREREREREREHEHSQEHHKITTQNQWFIQVSWKVHSATRTPFFNCSKVPFKEVGVFFS
jgi:hypothetical protein